ncbi:MAG: NTP transferase domain-containing protein [Pseudomonadales bacterium]|nr:NTP transferase domain-containing protein [Pseudomonadales bacterium]
MTGILDLVVLAGDRGPDDPLCRAAGVPAKALVPVGDRAVLVRVLETLDAAFPAAMAPTRLVSGPADTALAAAPTLAARLARRLADGGWRRLEPAASPASSALAALRETDPHHATLLTTGDHALLTPALARAFLVGARAHARDGADLAVGFVPLARVQARFPGARRTALRFRDAEVCTCNLFALLAPAAHGVIDLWREVERDRKRPWRMVRRLGPLVLVRFLLRRVTLAEALARLGRLAGARIVPVLLDEPEAAVDVDSVADWELVQAVIAERERAPRDSG